MEGTLSHVLEWLKYLFSAVGGISLWSFYKTWREGRLLGSQAKKIDQEIQQNDKAFEIKQLTDLYNTMKEERDYYRADNVLLRDENAKLHAAVGDLRIEMRRIQEVLDITQRELTATRETLENLQEQLIESEKQRAENAPTDYTERY